MVFLPRTVIFFFTTLSLLPIFSTAESITRRYELFHDLGNGFIPRNSYVALTASPSEDNRVDASYTLDAVLESSQDENGEECTDESCPSQSVEEIAMLELIKDGKFYRIKAVDLETGTEALTSVHPCSIRKSNFRETINLILSPKADLISLDYVPIISPILSKVSCDSFESSDETKSKPLQFTTSSITYSTSTPGMTIPLILPNMNLPKGAITMLPRDKTRPTQYTGQSSTSSSTGKGGDDQKYFQDMMTEEQGPPKSFLMRYWYIILPMVIMTFFSEAPEDPNAPKEGQGPSNQQGQNPSNVATATAAVAGASTAASSGKSRQRRGKRG